jgi:putative oxidoreductase
VNLTAKLMRSRAPAATLLIRVAVGCVFLSEGIQKFLFADQLGVGRFVKIGIPSPEVLAPFVGWFEIGCGFLILVGLLTRLAAIPLIAVMGVAIFTTKIPILMKSGFWAMAHEARTDFSMLLAGLFLLVVGAGPISLDASAGPGSVDREPPPAL